MVLTGSHMLEFPTGISDLGSIEAQERDLVDPQDLFRKKNCKYGTSLKSTHVSKYMRAHVIICIWYAVYTYIDIEGT